MPIPSTPISTLPAPPYDLQMHDMITSNPPFSKWETIFKDPMPTAAAIDRVVHHGVILELNLPKHAWPDALRECGIGELRVEFLRTGSRGHSQQGDRHEDNSLHRLCRSLGLERTAPTRHCQPIIGPPNGLALSGAVGISFEAM